MGATPARQIQLLALLVLLENRLSKSVALRRATVWSATMVLIREFFYVILLSRFMIPRLTHYISSYQLTHYISSYRITFGCRVGSSNSLDNVCWNPSQLLGLNNSIAVKDLHTLMFEGAYGISALLSSTIDAIQAAAENQISPSAVREASSQIGNATQSWLNNVWNGQECQTNAIQTMSSDAELTDLLTYQFHEESVNRMDWVVHWRCTGATFGCAGNTVATCPMAATCFDYLVGLFSSMMNAPGGHDSPRHEPWELTGSSHSNVQSLLPREQARVCH